MAGGVGPGHTPSPTRTPAVDCASRQGTGIRSRCRAGRRLEPCRTRRGPGCAAQAVLRGHDTRPAVANALRGSKNPTGSRTNWPGHSSVIRREPIELPRLALRRSNIATFDPALRGRGPWFRRTLSKQAKRSTAQSPGFRRVIRSIRASRIGDAGNCWTGAARWWDASPGVSILRPEPVAAPPKCGPSPGGAAKPHSPSITTPSSAMSGKWSCRNSYSSLFVRSDCLRMSNTPVFNSSLLGVVEYLRLRSPQNRQRLFPHPE